MTVLSIGLGIGHYLSVAAGDIPIVVTNPPTSVPAAFATNGWTLADPGTGGALLLTIVTLPDDGGSAITILQYQIGSGAWTAVGPLDGQKRATIPSLQNGTTYAIRLRAVNAVGAGAASAAKSATPSVPVASPTISVTQQPALPTITAGQRPSDLTIPLGTAERNPTGSPQPAPTRELKHRGTSVETASDWLSAQSVAGEKVFVRTKWTLDGAADAYSNVIQATVQAAAASPAINVPGTWTVSAASGGNRTATFTYTTFTGSAPITYDRSWRIDGMADQAPTASTTTTASFTFPAAQTPLLEARERATNAAGTVGPLSTSIQVAAQAQVLTLTQNAQGTAESDVAPGAITYNLTAPADYAGTYSTTTALLEAGPVFLVPPAIIGDTTAGSVQTARPGLVLHPADKPVTITRQWQRNGAPIPGATGATHTIDAADKGTALTVTETATNADGARSSTSTALAIPAGMAPSNTTTPAITGTLQVGQTLSLSDGTWAGDAPITYARQWKRGGTAISGATASAYVLLAADQGAIITCTVTATNVAGSAGATSADMGPVTASYAVTGLGAKLIGVYDLRSFEHLRANADGTGAITGVAQAVRHIRDLGPRGNHFAAQALSNPGSALSATGEVAWNNAAFTPVAPLTGLAEGMEFYTVVNARGDED